MKHWVISTLLVLLAGCAGSTAKFDVPPKTLSAIPLTTPVGCRFEKRVADDSHEQRSNFYFWRQAQRTETRDDLLKQGEIWERDHAGRLSYTRLFYPERVALEYTPGDLAAIGTRVDWEQLQSLLDPNALGKELKLERRENSAGMASEHYAGMQDGGATEIDWLPASRLPWRMLKKTQGLTIELRLAECAELSQFPVKPLAPEQLANLRQLDFSDLGDKESDPLVQRILQLTGGHHHEEH